MKLNIIFLILIVTALSNVLYAQPSQKFLLNFSYGVDIPAGDLAERFGYDFRPEIAVEYELDNSWHFGVHTSMLLGSTVKEDVLANIRSSDGLLIGQQENKAVITLKQRGFLVGIHAAKFINISKGPWKHGPRVGLGSSVFSHYIVFNDESASLNQLLGEYQRGYDRLSRGFTTEEFIGYQMTNRSGKLNIYAGFHLVQGFTQNLRPINFDTGLRDDSSRLDLLNGFRVGFSILLFENNTGEDIYY